MKWLNFGSDPDHYMDSGSMKCNKTDTSKSYGWIVMTFSEMT